MRVSDSLIITLEVVSAAVGVWRELGRGEPKAERITTNIVMVRMEG